MNIIELAEVRMLLDRHGAADAYIEHNPNGDHFWFSLYVEGGNDRVIFWATKGGWRGPGDVVDGYVISESLAGLPVYPTKAAVVAAWLEQKE